MKFSFSTNIIITICNKKMFTNNRLVYINSISFIISNFTIIVIINCLSISSIIKSNSIKICCKTIRKIKFITNKILITYFFSRRSIIISKVIYCNFINRKSRTTISRSWSYFIITSNKARIFNISFYFFIRNKPSNIFFWNIINANRSSINIISIRSN